MAKIGFINGIINGSRRREDVPSMIAFLIFNKHEVTVIEEGPYFYATPLQHTGLDLYVLVRSGGLSVVDRKDLRKVLKSGRRVLLLYTLQKPAFKATKGFASVSLFSTRERILEEVGRLTS